MQPPYVLQRVEFEQSTQVQSSVDAQPSNASHDGLIVLDQLSLILNGNVVAGDTVNNKTGAVWSFHWVAITHVKTFEEELTKSWLGDVKGKATGVLYQTYQHPRKYETGPMKSTLK